MSHSTPLSLSNHYIAHCLMCCKNTQIFLFQIIKLIHIILVYNGKNSKHTSANIPFIFAMLKRGSVKGQGHFLRMRNNLFLRLQIVSSRLHDTQSNCLDGLFIKFWTLEGAKTGTGVANTKWPLKPLTNQILLTLGAAITIWRFIANDHSTC